MRARATLLGHPIHPILIVLPLGLYISAVVLDVVTMFRPITELSIVAFWNIVVGTIGGVLAAVFGLLDWSKIPKGTRARRVGILHAVLNTVVLTLFVISAFMRADRDFYTVTTAGLILEIIGFSIAGVSGWLGGELVDRLGVGVHEGANLNAPSTLSGRAASDVGQAPATGATGVV